jgi:hypothetical protein
MAAMPGKATWLMLDKFALTELALDLQADQEEEHGHQPVIDPQQQAFLDFQRAKLDRNRCFKEGLVVGCKRRVRGDHGNQGGQHQQHAARSLKL